MLVLGDLAFGSELDDHQHDALAKQRLRRDALGQLERWEFRDRDDLTRHGAEYPIREPAAARRDPDLTRCPSPRGRSGLRLTLARAAPPARAPQPARRAAG